MHPWHEVNHFALFPKVLPAIIEVPKGSQIKYELDKESGLLKVDRILYSAVHYPANYGFIPQTYGDDNDPLDILVLSQFATEPLCIMRARPIGVMKMIDSGESDDKIIAIHVDDPMYNNYHHINDCRRMRLKHCNDFLKIIKCWNKKRCVSKAFWVPKKRKN